jgi:inner membrane protein
LDSVTHIVLGAAIGDKLLGKKIGRKAAWIGALAKTFPDFDLLFSGLDDPKRYILYHRSYTHSFFVEFLTAFPMAFLFYLLFKKKIAYREWFILWIVCLWGHSLVDIFTNYGTRIFLPFSTKLVSLNNIAIADLFLTVPILIMVVIALFYNKDNRSRHRLMTSSLVYAVLYFGMTFVNKAVADSHFKQSISTKNIVSTNYLSNPTILNNLLWYSLVKTDSNILVGEYSLLQKTENIEWRSYPINDSLLQNCKSEDAQMLEWFSQGFYMTNMNNDTLEVFIPKFGRGDLDKTKSKETFLFYYQIYCSEGKWKFSAHQPSRKEMKFDEAFKQLYKHILASKK